MPYYSDPSYYYGSGSGTYGGYGGGSGGGYSGYYPSGYTASGIYQSGYQGGGSSPYYSGSGYSSYSRGLSSGYVPPSTRSQIAARYKPKLSTISETGTTIRSTSNPLIPLTRIRSPKLSYHTSPKFVAPKPISINTADIDVSATKYQKRNRPSMERILTDTESDSKENEGQCEEVQGQNTNSPFMPRVDGTDPFPNRCTIKRGRAVVRLSTIRRGSRGSKSNKKKNSNTKTVTNEEAAEKSNSTINTAMKPQDEKSSWRDRFGDELNFKPAPKKSPGELMRERYLLKESEDKENAIKSSELRGVTSLPIFAERKIQIDVDIANHMVDNAFLPRLGLAKSPSFHDICADISSDKIDDDLNAGELRRRASIVQEAEIEIINNLQKSGSGIIEMIVEHTEEIDNMKGESTAVKRKSKKPKKTRTKIIATVAVEDLPTKPDVVEHQHDEEKCKDQKIKVVVDEVVEDHTVHKIFKLPKKRLKVEVESEKNVEEKETQNKKVQAKLEELKSVSKEEKKEEAQNSETKIKKVNKEKEEITLKKNEKENKSDKPKIDLKVEKVNKEQKEDKSQLELKKDDEGNKVNKGIEKQEEQKSKPKVEKVDKDKKEIKFQAELKKSSTSPLNSFGKSNEPTLEISIDKKEKCDDRKKLEPKSAPILRSFETEKKTGNEKVPLSPSLEAKREDAKTTVINAINKPSHFTFDADVIAAHKLASKNEKPKAPAGTSSVTPKSPFTQKPLIDSANLTKERVAGTPGVAKPKPIVKLQRSESGEDFWAHIGSRETVYMNVRKTRLRRPWEENDSIVEDDELKNSNEKIENVTENMKSPTGPKNSKSNIPPPLEISKKVELKDTISIKSPLKTDRADLKISNNSEKSSTDITTTPKIPSSTPKTPLSTPKTPLSIELSKNKQSKDLPYPKEIVGDISEKTKEQELQSKMIKESSINNNNNKKSSISSSPQSLESSPVPLSSPSPSASSSPLLRSTSKVDETSQKSPPKINTGLNAKSPETKINEKEFKKDEQSKKDSPASTAIAKKITLLQTTDHEKNRSNEDTFKIELKRDDSSKDKNLYLSSTTENKNISSSTSSSSHSAADDVSHSASKELGRSLLNENNNEDASKRKPLKLANDSTQKSDALVINARVGVNANTVAVAAVESDENSSKKIQSIESRSTSENNTQLNRPKDTFAKRSNEQYIQNAPATPTQTNLESGQFVGTAKLSVSSERNDVNKVNSNLRENQHKICSPSSNETNTSKIIEKQQSTTEKINALPDEKISNSNKNEIKQEQRTILEKDKQAEKEQKFLFDSEKPKLFSDKLKNESSAVEKHQQTQSSNPVTISSDAASATVAADDDVDKNNKIDHRNDHNKSNNNDNNNSTLIVQSNLSKFPTVSDLNRCLADVDADLSDYIPSDAPADDDSYDSSEEDDNNMKKKNLRDKKDENDKFDPNKAVKSEPKKKLYVKQEAPPYPLVATPRPLWKREKVIYPNNSESESDETDSDSECSSTSDEYSENELNPSKNGIVRMSTCSSDSGFDGGTAPSSPKRMLGAHEARDSPREPPSLNPVYKIETSHDNDDDSETSYTFSQFQKSGRITAPATVIPRFKKYSVEDFHFLTVLGKGSFGKVLLAELRNTEYYYAVKCLKKDVVLEDDDVDSTLIERKVLALGTKHPYLCHLFCTFQTESHLFFVMEYLNGGDLMFHIQQSGRFPEARARFYAAEIISGLKFLHKKGIIYRDLKLDNVLLDFDGHVRIADFGMCKLQIYLDKTADSFCGTPDYMAPEIIKGDKYNQNVDWWSFGVLLYEMLIGQSPFSGCDEDELFWSICNEVPWFPIYISKEATDILKGLLDKDASCRIGSQYSPKGDICSHVFFSEIDWDLLDRRAMTPPFKPQVKHPLDTQYFDKTFTRERVRLTPIDKEILQSMDQQQFQGFSYTNPNATLD